MRKRTALCCCCAGTRSPSWHLCFQPKLIVAALTASYMKICAWTWYFSLIQMLAMSFLCFICRPPMTKIEPRHFDLTKMERAHKHPSKKMSTARQIKVEIKPKENILTVLFVFYIHKSKWRPEDNSLQLLMKMCQTPEGKTSLKHVIHIVNIWSLPLQVRAYVYLFCASCFFLYLSLFSSSFVSDGIAPSCCKPSVESVVTPHCQHKGSFSLWPKLRF